MLYDMAIRNRRQATGVSLGRVADRQAYRILDLTRGEKRVQYVAASCEEVMGMKHTIVTVLVARLRVYVSSAGLPWCSMPIAC
jgi:hypothetical protein